MAIAGTFPASVVPSLRAVAAALLLSGAIARATFGQATLPAVTAAPLPQQQAIIGTAVPADLADARIATWSSPLPDAINMHVVRAPGGLILFDTLRRSDQVADALKVIDLLGEPVAAIVITHAHTDHYGGLSFFRERYPGVPVYASAGIVKEMRDDEVPDNAARRAMFGDRFPMQATIDANLPDHLVTDGEPVTIAGLRVVPLVMGPSESAGAVVYRLPELDAAVVGDLVNVLTVAAPMLSLEAWLAQLDQLDEALPAGTTIHVGHGPSGPAAPLVEDQRRYLLLLRRLVEEAAGDRNGVSADETADIVLRMRLAYPHHRGAAFMPPEKLIEASVGWVVQLQAEAAQPRNE